MAELELRFLGDLEVRRGGAVLGLPPSRKTRALLAYLVLHPRSFRREHLCELLWDIPDDPRGSLRWSLSKLRQLVDGDRTRIVADRSSVGFDASEAEIDVLQLRMLVEDGLERATTEALEQAAARYCGTFLEGLELSNFHTFHAWCIAERERTSRAQAGVLRTLVDRLAARESERALPYADALVGVSPYDESARAALIRLLVGLGRTEEAEQQYRLGAHMLKEAGLESSGLLYRASRGAPRSASARASRTADAPAPRVRETRRPLVGREAEAETLAAALSRVVQLGKAELVLVCGEPGIGKTRLLETAALASRDANALILEAGAHESEAMRPFALWIDALRRLPADTGAEVFGRGDLDNRERLLEGLSDLVAREAAERPVVLIFDDIQWCDESSAAALHYIARTNRERPLLGVLAAREGELRDNVPAQRMLRGLRHARLLQEVKLGPLKETDVRRLIEARAPQANSAELSRHCGGNPLLAIELARAESEGQSGNSLDDLVRERLARFEIEAGEILRWAAVLAPRIEVASLVRVSGADRSLVGEVLENAERHAMIVPTDECFRFSHDLIARSIYKDISPARRRIMHGRVAELLEQDAAVDLGRAADLAHHAAQSGDPALAARAMVSAGRLCLRFFANDDAATFARKGLALVDRLADRERVCLTLDLREIMLAAAPVIDWESAAGELVELAEQALDHGALTQARLGYQMASYLQWMHGRWSGAREETLQAERVSRGSSEEDQIVGMAETAKCLAMLERDLSQADALLMEASALAVRKRLRHSAIPMALGLLRFHENKLDEAEELLKDARTLCKSAGDRVNEFMANEYLAMIDIERGGFEAALGRCATLIDIGGKLREGSEAPFARALEALCRYALHDETAPLEEALAELRIADAKHRLAYTLNRAALLDVECGRLREARTRAGEALEQARALERSSEMMLAHFALARACQASGDDEGFERHAAAVAAFDAVPMARWARKRVELLAALHE